jgi:hypothetical protein
MDEGGRSRREQAIDDPTDGGGRSRREHVIDDPTDGGGRSRREHVIDDPTDGGGRSRREHVIESNAGAIAESTGGVLKPAIPGFWIRQPLPALPYLLHPCSRPAIPAGMTSFP